MDIVERLRPYGQGLAVVGADGTQYSFAELADRIVAIADELAGDSRPLVLLEADNSIDAIATMLAAIGGHLVVMPYAPGNDVLADQLTASFGPSHIARVRTDGRFGFERVGDAPPMHPDLSVMLSTSGSTGSAKCVRLSAANLIANAESIADYLEITPADRGLLTLPIFYSYGLSIVTSHLLAGAAVLLPDRSMIEPGFWDYARRFSATSFAGVPHIYEMLERVGLAENAPPSLRHFTQAGGRLPPERVARFGAVARQIGARFFVMYGQTEATARMAYLPPDAVESAAGAIGMAIPGGRLTLRDEQGFVIDGAGVVGELIYSGPNVMMGYAETRSDLPLPPCRSELATGDLAMRREDGFFEISGRLTRFIKVYGNRIALDQVEMQLQAEGHRVLATGVDEVLLIAASDPGSNAAITRTVRSSFGINSDRLQIVNIADFPKLPSGKPDYATLKGWIRLPGGENPMPVDRTSARAGVMAAFRASFGHAVLDDQSSFLSLGGDSLNYVNMAIGLEAYIPALPEQWQVMTIGELTAAAEAAVPPVGERARRPRMTHLDALRGLACLLVVALHVVGNPDSGIGVPWHSPWRAFTDSLTFVRMPLFTALAGFFYALMRVTTATDLLRRKAETLLLPGITVSALAMALYAFRYGYTGEPVVDLLLGFQHLWFLFMLFYTFVIVALLERKGPRSWKLWAVVATCIFCVHFLVPSDARTIYLQFPVLFPCFVFGIFLRRIDWLTRSTPLALFSAVGAIGFWLLVIASRLGGFTIVAEFYIGYVASFLAIIALVRFFPSVPVLAWIGAYSFTIYLWHPTANAAVRAVIDLLHFPAIPWLRFVVGMIAGTLPPIIVHMVVKRVVRPVPALRLPAAAITGA
ncbi:MAG: AMP-binding protein [Sphingobium sp.]